MKKIIIAILVLASSASSTFAIDLNKYSIFSKTYNTKTFSELMNYLDADYEQTQQLEIVFSMTEKKMKSALKAENEVAAEKAIYFNLGNVKAVLSEKQYKKYLILINASVYNNNTDTYFASL